MAKSAKPGEERNGWHSNPTSPNLYDSIKFRYCCPAYLGSCYPGHYSPSQYMSMSQFDEKMGLYLEAVEELDLDVHPELLAAVAKSLGPSIYNDDASIVSSSDEEELDRVRENFLVEKLGLEDGPELDDAIDDVIDQLGSGNRRKYRAVFYTLLTQHFQKEDVFLGASVLEEE